jgi:hypothetical protein
MSYQRIIPRDLFNESKLLKCLGRVALLIHERNYPTLEMVHDGKRFLVEQEPGSGDLFCSNVKLKVNGEIVPLLTSYNSKGPYPMHYVDEEVGEVILFNDDGSFTDEFLEFIK